MKIVVAPDSYKGSVSAMDAAEAIRSGWCRTRPGDTVMLLPIADGGEGTVRAIAPAHGKFHSVPVTGALPRQVAYGQFAIIGSDTAVVELATAAGLTLIPAHRRDPKRTTTYGFGELIARAASVPGVKRLVLALGGSATSDGGAGALQTLGVSLKNAAGRKIARGGAALSDLKSADFTKAERFPKLEIVIACDVDNPLLGERGATYVFAPQKGATEADLPLLEAALTRYADVLTEATGRDVRNVPGTGAAGGTAAGLLWLFPQAILRPGIEITLDTVNFDDTVRDADIVITGEGRLDAQTLGGKAVAGVVARTRAVAPRAKVIAIAGSVSGDIADLAATLGLSAVYSLVREGVSVDNAIANAPAHVAAAAERAAHDFAP